MQFLKSFKLFFCLYYISVFYINFLTASSASIAASDSIIFSS